MKTIFLVATLVIGVPAWAKTVLLEAGESYTMGRTTVICEGASNEESKWWCDCWWSFAHMGAVEVWAFTGRQAETAGLRKCQAERAPETDRASCRKMQ